MIFFPKFYFENTYRVIRVVKIERSTLYSSPSFLNGNVTVNNLKQQLLKYEPLLQVLKINTFFSIVDENYQSFLINQKDKF